MFTPRVTALLGASACSLAAFAALAEPGVALDNLVVLLGATTYRIPHLEIAGSSLPQSEIAQLFSGDAAAIDARLARFSASRVQAPAIDAESKRGAETARSVSRDVVMEKIVAGRIGASMSPGGELTVAQGDGDVQRATWGASVARGADLRQMTRLSLGARKDANEPRQPLVDEEVIEKLRFEDVRKGFVVETGRAALTGVKARPLAVPLAQLAERLDKTDGQVAGAGAVLRELLDALGAFEAARIEASDIAATGKGEPLDKPYKIAIGRIGLDKIADAGAAAASVEKLSLLASDGGRLALGRVALRDVQLAALLQRDYPRVGHIDARALDADLPDPKTSEKSRVKFRLDNVAADFDNFVEGTPTKFSAQLDHARFDLVARGETEGTAQFLALGYKELDVSGAAAAEWREKTAEASIGPVVIESRDMGVLRVAATLGNVSSAVFSSMPIVAKAASLAISLTSFDLTLEGGELVERVLANEAQRRKISVETARAEYAKAASEALSGLAGGGEKAKKIGAALAAFVQKPKRLHIRIHAQEGVNALDALSKKPGEVLESAEVEADATP